MCYSLSLKSGSIHKNRKLESRKLIYSPKMTKRGPIIDYRIDYTGIGPLGGQPHISSKKLPK